MHRVDGMNRALQTLCPQVLVAECHSATLYEIIRYGADLWEAHRELVNKGPEVVGQRHLKEAAK